MCKRYLQIFWPLDGVLQIIYKVKIKKAFLLTNNNKNDKYISITKILFMLKFNKIMVYLDKFNLKYAKSNILQQKCHTNLYIIFNLYIYLVHSL